MGATHYRARRQVRRIFRVATQTTDIRIDDRARSAQDSHPRYREAKKAAIEFDFRRAPAVQLAPRVEDFKFVVFLLHWEAHHIPSAPVTRPPPLQV
jgi:hypothetical protein